MDRVRKSKEVSVIQRYSKGPEDNVNNFPGLVIKLV